MLLSYLDSLHDFKRYLGMVDRPNSVRGEPADKLHYWRNFAFNILRTGMGGTPVHSHFLNGCYRFGIHPEELGMKLAKETTQINKPVEIQYEAKTPGSFYTKLSDVLSDYKQDGLIPLVVDTEFCLHKDSESIREMSANFAICKNMEMYSDPSRTAKRDFHSAEWIEVAGDSRVYNDTIIGGSLNIKISGTVNSIEIEYSGDQGVYVTENYKLTHKILANTIGNCKDAFNSLLRSGDFHDSEFDYCSMLASNAFVQKASWTDVPLLRSMAIHLMKKRHGDQLQVKSCLQAITYERGDKTRVFGAEKPCVFWSYDRLAIAFAILLGIPCVHQSPNKNIVVYLPLKKEGAAQNGGACTRANLEYTSAEVQANVVSSMPIVNLINTKQGCLKRYVELHLEPDKVQYSPFYLIYIIKIKGLTKFVSKELFTEEFIYSYNNDYPQLHIKEDREEGTVTILNEQPSILFYSFKYQLYINLSGGFIVVYKMDGSGSTAADTVKEIYKFSSLVLNSDDYIEGQEDQHAAEARSVMEGGSLTPKRNPLMNLLKKMKQVEDYMVVFPDSRERFMAQDKSHFIERGGYTSYEMVFFFRAAVELFDAADDKAQFCRAFRSIFHTLNALKETQLSSEILLFLNTFTNFHSRSEGTEEAKPIIAAVLKMAKTYIEEMQAAMESFGFDQHKMINYLEKHVPHGILGNYYYRLESALQSYSAKPVAGVITTNVKPRRSQSRSQSSSHSSHNGARKRSLHASLKAEVPRSKRERKNVTKRSLNANLGAELGASRINRPIVRGTRRLSRR